MEKIAIYGVGGLYNYGCEAIIRGTVKFIRKKYPNSQITYYSKCYDYDKKQISDLGIVVKNIGSTHRLWRKIISKTIDIFRIPIVPFLENEFKQILKESDIIFSVGGDIYSVPAHLRGQSRYRYVNPMVEFGKLAKINKKTLIIYGASIGPFGEYNTARRYYMDHLREVDQIYCREYKSIEYLKSLGVRDNVEFLPDPAFFIDNSDMGLEFSNSYVGINLSELSFKELYGDVNDDTISKLCCTLKTLSQDLNLKLMLIPHVFSPTTVYDNDYIFLERIYSRLRNEHQVNAVLVVPTGFMDVKKHLSKCRFVICARMHCAVNAVTIGVPAIFLSYSVKAKGMASFIYGDEHWMLPLEEINSRLIPLAMEMNSKADDIKQCIKFKLKKVEVMLDKAY